MAIETHPWQPFIPKDAELLIMGTFPPGPQRWSMDFYYPNRTNDFWRIMAYIFLGDKEALVDEAHKSYYLDRIKGLMESNHIALSDTAYKIRRLKGNASDKYLEILEPVDLATLLLKMPLCRNIATTGQKAAEIIAMLTDTEVPKMGEQVTTPTGLHIWRMPSTSRAYPLALEKKAVFYKTMLQKIGILANA
ncbi:MAG: uracil-DNA glycosylase family protein [Muribaculum sp.]|nr:uracil-DNA glycosylase family protein [Muribaculum sp.]